MYLDQSAAVRRNAGTSLQLDLLYSNFMRNVAIDKAGVVCAKVQGQISNHIKHSIFEGNRAERVCCQLMSPSVNNGILICCGW